jgi:hypothetical protein
MLVEPALYGFEYALMSVREGRKNANIAEALMLCSPPFEG